MAIRRPRFRNFSFDRENVRIKINLSRFSEQYGRAQFALDSAIMTSMIPYMPMQSGVFIDKTKAMSAALAGTGTVVAAAPPDGRFLYEGKGMVDELTGSTYARKGTRKVLVSQYRGHTNAKEDLTYGRSSAEPRWFEPAKRKDLKSWLRVAKKTAGGGARG